MGISIIHGILKMSNVKKMVKCIGIYKKSWYQHSLTFWLVIICSILTLCTSKLSYNHRAENKGGLKVA